MKNIASSAILTLAVGLFHSHGGASTLPVELRASLPMAELAGRAKLTVWGLEVYNASLWVAPGFKAGDYASHRFALELAYLRNLSGDAIAKRSISEMRRQAELGDSKEAAWTAQLQAALPDVKTGDRITGVHTPGLGLQFLVNGQAGASIRDPELARLFFGIWLSPLTSEPRMRQALLALLQP